MLSLSKHEWLSQQLGLMLREIMCQIIIKTQRIVCFNTALLLDRNRRHGIKVFDNFCIKLFIIKENDKLWKAFKNLQAARNSFAHNGIAKVDDKIVDETNARHFIIKANEIINYIKEGLPEDLRWPEFKHEIAVEANIPLLNLKKNDS